MRAPGGAVPTVPTTGAAVGTAEAPSVAGLSPVSPPVPTGMAEGWGGTRSLTGLAARLRREAEVARRAAFLLRAIQEAMAAFAEPDPDLIQEQAELVAARAAEDCGDHGRHVAEWWAPDE